MVLVFFVFFGAFVLVRTLKVEVHLLCVDGAEEPVVVGEGVIQQIEEALPAAWGGSLLSHNLK